MFAELSITSNFTFLTGASHPEEYVQRAACLGLPAIAIADDNSVAGIVRAHAASREIARQVAERQAQEARDGPIGPPAPKGLANGGPDWANIPRLIPAARLCLATGATGDETAGVTLTALPRDRTGWASLCRMLTTGRRRAEKGACHLTLDDVLQGAEGLQLLLHPPHPTQAADWLDQARRRGGRRGAQRVRESGG